MRGHRSITMPSDRVVRSKERLHAFEGAVRPRAGAPDRARNNGTDERGVSYATPVMCLPGWEGAAVFS